MVVPSSLEPRILQVLESIFISHGGAKVATNSPNFIPAGIVSPHVLKVNLFEFSINVAINLSISPN